MGERFERLRELVRHRSKLVQVRTRAKNEINGKLIDAIRKSHCSVQAAVYCGSELEGGAFPDGHELGSALMVKTNWPPCTFPEPPWR